MIRKSIMQALLFIYQKSCLILWKISVIYRVNGLRKKMLQVFGEINLKSSWGFTPKMKTEDGKLGYERNL